MFIEEESSSSYTSARILQTYFFLLFVFTLKVSFYVKLYKVLFRSKKALTFWPYIDRYLECMEVFLVAYTCFNLINFYPASAKQIFFVIENTITKVR
jgi:hypothetical protein